MIYSLNLRPQQDVKPLLRSITLILTCIFLGCTGLFVGCSVTETYKAAYSIGYDLPTYQSRMLPIDKPSGKTRLQQEIDYDKVVKAYVKDYGKPDYLYVESSEKIYLVYRSPEKFVTFTRSSWITSASEVKEAWVIPSMFKKQMPPLKDTARENVTPKSNKTKLPETASESSTQPAYDSSIDKDAAKENISQDCSKTTPYKINSSLTSQALNVKSTPIHEKNTNQKMRLQQIKKPGPPKGIDKQTPLFSDLTPIPADEKTLALIQKMLKAAKDGDSALQYGVGYGYFYGYGFLQDYKKATFWFKKAAEQGHPEAQYYLGQMYFNGTGVPQNTQKTKYWYTKAAEQGDAVSQFKLGFFYLLEEDFQDSQKAEKWFEEAAKQGNPEHQYILGSIYHNGKAGLTKDMKKVIYWYTKAAKQGYAEAQYMMGNMLYEGVGIPQNYIYAYAWYNLAVSNGYEKAKKARDTFLSNTLTTEQIVEAQKLSKQLVSSSK